jgi:MFS superfamily sulfate permease-like transporter
MTTAITLLAGLVLGVYLGAMMAIRNVLKEIDMTVEELQEIILENQYRND